MTKKEKKEEKEKTKPVKKKNELNPEYKILNNLSDKKLEELKKLAEELDESNLITKEEKEETFYKIVVDKLFDGEDIETKTEYLNEKENFVGTKLSYMARVGNMPYIETFVNIFEKKRISLNRKGRQEIIMALHERFREEQEGTTKLMNMLKGS